MVVPVLMSLKKHPSNIPEKKIFWSRVTELLGILGNRNRVQRIQHNSSVYIHWKIRCNSKNSLFVTTFFSIPNSNNIMNKSGFYYRSGLKGEGRGQRGHFVPGL
jgi:hypothetical protein